MSEIINIIDAMPSVEVLNFVDTHRRAVIHSYSVSDAGHSLLEELSERYPLVPPNLFGSFLIDLLPDRVVSNDYRIFDVLNRLSETLEQRKGEPVLLINDHEVKRMSRVGNNPPVEYSEKFTAVSYGFSGGAHYKERVHRYAASGSLSLCVNAPQTMIYYDDIGVDFTNSAPVSRWNLQPMGHISAFLLSREIDFSTVSTDGNSYAVKEKAGMVMIGNGAIQEFIESRPELTEVIDGCQYSYRNGGLNPAIGRQIAKAFKLDHLADGVKQTLQWM